MNNSLLCGIKEKPKTGFVKRQVIEYYRMGAYSERQVLEAVGITRTILRRWNRSYQRYKNRMYKPLPNLKFMNTKTSNELAALKKKLAELERIVGQKQILIDFKDKMIDIAEEMYGIDIKKKFSTRQSDTSSDTAKDTPTA